MAATSGGPLPPDTNRGPTILGITWFTTGLACIIVAFRLHTRLKKRSSGWDDYLILLALLMSIYGSILNTLQVKYGFGRHIEYVGSNLPKVLMYTTLVEMQNGMATFLVKTSVCLLIMRLIRGTHPKVRWLLWITIAVLFAITLATEMFIGLSCIPFQKIWEPERHGSCVSKSIQTQLIRILGIIGTVTDFVCVIIPTLIIRSLRMDRRAKIAIIVIISMGFLTAACGIGKSVTVEIVSEDFTWDYVQVEIWSLVEQNLGVTVASLPVLRPYLATVASFFKSITSFSSRSHLSTFRKEVFRKPHGDKHASESPDSDENRLVALEEVAIPDKWIRKETHIGIESLRNDAYCLNKSSTVVDPSTMSFVDK